MELKFKRGSGELKSLGSFTTIESVNKEISRFLETHKYKSYYTRLFWETENPYDGKLSTPHLTFDVGSWSEFFYLYLTDEEIKQLPNNYKNLIPKENQNDKTN